ncbi:MAG: recombinase RecA [Desulfurivibrio sp.]|nr:recombinase RecA [Desulfurivibrio sp.]
MAVTSADKEKTLDSAINQIQKQFGKGAIMRLGADERVAVPAISTGILSLDIACGIGGIPCARITEIYGPESSGKTTLALQIIASAQRRGGSVAFIDAEHALDVTYAERLGVNADELLVSQPDYGEQALEIAEVLIRSAAIDVIVVDSVAALTPKAEIDGNIGDSHVGLQARLMSQAMRKLASLLQRTNTAIIFINQLRMKIGVMFGNPETTTGGNALKFYSSMRIDIRRISTIKDGEEMIGNRVKAKLVKNKVAPPFKVAEFDIIFGEGSSREGDLLDLAVEQNIVDKSGAWYSYNGERIGQGRENSKTYLKEHPEMTDEIEAKVRMGFGLAMPGQEPEREQPEQSLEKPAKKGGKA